MHKSNYITVSSGNLPLPLREIPNPPSQLFVLGNQECLNTSDLKVAIVGTRRATSAGLAIARRLAQDLARAGVVVVSGLALGIDQAAHRGCLDGGGRTIAVLANGLDKIYPHQHRSLAEDIIKTGGAIISEYKIGTPSFPSQFLERNRIVSGLCRGVIVVEAPFGSGALNTAAHTLKQNREIFVVPGAVTSQNYAGSHKLIRQGATLVTCAKDIFDCFNISSAKTIQTALPMLGQEQKKIFKTLQSAAQPLTADKLVELTKINAPILNQNLTTLLIEGFVKESNGKYFVL